MSRSKGEKLYGVILAGGSGTRLWPRSRKRTPKQLVSLVSQHTMLQETYERILPLIPKDRVWVVAGRGYLSQIKKQLADLPENNLIVEPDGRGSAPAIGLAAVHLERKDPNGIMVCLPADHVIRQDEDFRRLLLAAGKVAEEGYLVTLGIVPSRPETGYGYIHRGECLVERDGHSAYRVLRFTEKPDERTAEEFCRAGEYFWNSGIFVWQVSTVLAEMKRLMPDLYASLMEIRGVLGTSQERRLKQIWSSIKTQAIDYGLMEKAERVAVFPIDIGWSDVGSWLSLLELLPLSDEENAIVGDHVGLDTRRSVILGSKRLITTVGVEDLVIVDTEDALLVCRKDRVQDVKRLVELLGDMGREEVL